jgi:hypothetical protein
VLWRLAAKALYGIEVSGKSRARAFDWPRRRPSLLTHQTVATLDRDTQGLQKHNLYELPESIEFTLAFREVPFHVALLPRLQVREHLISYPPWPYSIIRG